MSRLEALCVQFQTPRYPASRPRPLLARSVLPALTQFEFGGVYEYLEDLLVQIEAPLLNQLWVTFYMELTFVVPQLHQWISHAELFKTYNRACVETSHRGIRFAINGGETHKSPRISLAIGGVDLDRQLTSLVQLCSSPLPLLSTLVQLNIVDPVPPDSQSHRNMNTTRWLRLLDPFTAVKDLRLSDQVAPPVCQALEELAEEKVTEVLPALQNIYLSGLRPLEPIPKFIEGFVAARQLSGHPVAVNPWGDRGKNESFLSATRDG
ncbi:hypothetical protein F5148DRAFT_1282202 [Russula earlei]|uniref:Uncharacterized protein n=1 Tax=Russula earlei TaxID=71964 RepID=A0ACC0UEN6_9AGAM|nr:hypothetical protein F5148DRAFT_1282202 [Russula earlei]